MEDKFAGVVDKIGCDFSVKPHPSIAALEHASMKFVGRYGDGRPDFDISPPEAHSYRAAGIDVILTCERTFADWMLNAGEAGGYEAATVADDLARACGMDGIPVYFACDFDAQPWQQPQINATLFGCSKKIGLARTGLYAGIGPISRAFDDGAIKWAWQTIAWSFGNWDPRVHVRQFRSFVLDGADCDYDLAVKADYGQWPRPVAPAHGPYRHLTDGKSTFADIAADRPTPMVHLLSLSAEHYTAEDVAVAGGKVLPAGIPYYTSLP